MATYVTNISSGKLKELLGKLRKEDTLIIFHTSKEKQIPIDMITLFAGAKGTVEFRESEDDLEIAFEIGKLSAGSADRPQIIGDSPVFNKINSLIGGKKSPAPKTGKTPSAQKVENTAAAKKAPAPKKASQESASDKTQKTASKPVSKDTKPAPKSNAKQKAPKKDLIAFDNAFDNFTDLMDSLKTDKYDPTGCSMGIISAIRLMNEDPSLTFEAALPTTATAASAKKFLSKISKEDVDKVIEAAKEVVKYDS